MQGSANLNLMIKAARKAGRSLVKDFREVENLQVSSKGPGDFVSKADREAERIIREELMGARRPTAGSARRPARPPVRTRPGDGSSIRSTGRRTTSTACRTGRSRSRSSTRARSWRA